MNDYRRSGQLSAAGAWASKKKVAVKLGSEAHKAVFCRHFVQTHVRYDPETLPWPELDGGAHARLRSVPFWREVLHTEKRACAIVEAFTETIEDPVLKDAVALQAFEEGRHADLLRVMIRRYGIDAPEQPLDPLPSDLVTAFKDFGFGECMDCYLGAGVFKVARASQFLPESLFEIFDTLMYEETRHVVFFVNWMAWSHARRGPFGVLARPPATLWFYLRALRRMAALALRGAQANDGKDFAATQAGVFPDAFSFRGFLEDCYAENARRMGELDPELMKPTFLPRLTRAALSAMRPRDPPSPGAPLEGAEVRLLSGAGRPPEA